MTQTSLLCARPWRPDGWKADAFEQPFFIRILLYPYVTLSLLRSSVCITQPAFAVCCDLLTLSVSSEGRVWKSFLSTSEWSEFEDFSHIFKRQFGMTMTKTHRLVMHSRAGKGREHSLCSSEHFAHHLLGLDVSPYLFCSEHLDFQMSQELSNLLACFVADACKRAQQWKCRYQQWRWGDRLEEQVLLNVLLYHQSPSTASFFSLQNKPLCPFLTLNQCFVPHLNELLSPFVLPCRTACVL